MINNKKISYLWLGVIYKIKSIVETYKALEKELASGNIDKKDIVKKYHYEISFICTYS